MSKNSKAICITIGGIAIFYICMGFFLDNFNKAVFKVEEVNAKEYVEFKDVSIKIKDVDIINKENESFVMIDLIASQESDRQVLYPEIMDMSLHINDIKLESDMRYLTIDWDKVYSEDTTLALPDDYVIVDGKRSMQLFYKIDKEIADNIDSGQKMKLEYPLWVYYDEIIDKSNKKELFRKIGILNYE